MFLHEKLVVVVTASVLPSGVLFQSGKHHLSTLERKEDI